MAVPRVGIPAVPWMSLECCGMFTPEGNCANFEKADAFGWEGRGRLSLIRPKSLLRQTLTLMIFMDENGILGRESASFCGAPIP
ncbi:hypothetical protein CEXT_335331 [Caerostris extrusa]|uniref:Uncharacterized protein n=1 Tax=Caerostris extrusa TaxID=172846 RepID=A0AAV4NMQ7_CAEEX|nr:hypothetical protein CEXT_335331 [Caerostris extrusa]